MNHPEISTDIPLHFYPHLSQQPFQSCINCQKNVLQAGQEYVIEKAVRRYPDYPAQDVIFEYAMCMDCVLLMRSEFSEDSLKRIQAHMLQNKDMIARRQRLLEEKNYSLKSWIGRCLMTNKPQDELKEYQLFAHCRGHQMLFNSMPYMLSAEAMDVMSSLLSDKTLGEMNRFMDDNFGLPPELKKQLKDRPVSFI